MTRILFYLAFVLGFTSIAWMSQLFINAGVLALTVTLLIGGVFTIGAVELLQFRRATETLTQVVENTSGTVENLKSWLAALPGGLQNPVQQRVEGERVGLPAPVLTPYLVGLLVMLGLLGTFVGMVDTLQGAVAALRESAELEAIRAGLAAPMQGLSLAFGTSVAGVSASAMLGLMSTLSRRERVLATRQLDKLIASHLRDFSLNYNRHETFKALQVQSQALPDVAIKMEAVADKLERMGETLSDHLNAKQDAFNDAVATRYTQLAESVAASLKESLAESGKRVGDGIAPIVKQMVETVRADLVETTLKTHRDLSDTVSRQLETLQTEFGATSERVGVVWQQGIDAHRHANEFMLESIQESARQASVAFTQTGKDLLASLDERARDYLQHQVSADERRLNMTSECITKSQQETFSLLNETVSNLREELQDLNASQRKALKSSTEEFLAMCASMTSQWQQADERAQVRHSELSNALRDQVSEIQEHTGANARCLIEQHAQLFEQSEQLLLARQRSEDEWLVDYRRRMDAITKQLADQLQLLRDEEHQRGDAAVERLSELQATLAKQLATLGQSLEAPMSRLIDTASEAPRAAAEIIAQLRAEISKNIERDNSLLDERKQTLSELNKLAQALNENTTAQGAAVEQLVVNSRNQLEDLGERLTRQVQSELGKLSEVADHFSGSAAEMASLGDAFSAAVMAFGQSNQQLLEGLASIERSLDQSAIRSDEQLGYYVAQAREIIDHSISSQSALLEQMRHAGGAVRPEAEIS